MYSYRFIADYYPGNEDPLPDTTIHADNDAEAEHRARRLLRPGEGGVLYKDGKEIKHIFIESQTT